MKVWSVTAELNMDASNIEHITVLANTERKAYILAQEEIYKRFPKIFYSKILSVVEEGEKDEAYRSTKSRRHDNA